MTANVPTITTRAMQYVERFIVARLPRRKIGQEKNRGTAVYGPYATSLLEQALQWLSPSTSLTMAGGINRYVATIMVASLYEMWSAATICDRAGGSENCKVH